MEKKIPDKKRPRILSFGEILFDRLPTGDFLGGAPCNFAVHARQCGADAAIFSRVGTDVLGQKARTALREFGVAERWIQDDPDKATGIVNVTTAANGEPTYDIVADSAWDFILGPASLETEALRSAKFDAIVCGTLAQRSECSRAALRVLRHVLRDVPVFYDVNLRAPHTPLQIVRETLPGVTLLKLNETEADVFADMLGVPRSDFAALGTRLCEAYGIRVVLVTLGPRGCVMVSDEGLFESPAAPARVVSTVGAGDSMAALFLCGWLRRAPTPELLALANKLAAWVTTQAGATPLLPPGLRDEISRVLDERRTAGALDKK